MYVPRRNFAHTMEQLKRVSKYQFNVDSKVSVKKEYKTYWFQKDTDRTKAINIGGEPGYRHVWLHTTCRHVPGVDYSRTSMSTLEGHYLLNGSTRTKPKTFLGQNSYED